MGKNGHRGHREIRVATVASTMFDKNDPGIYDTQFSLVMIFEDLLDVR